MWGGRRGGMAFKGYLACLKGVLGEGDRRKEVRALCHEVGHSYCSLFN